MVQHNPALGQALQPAGAVVPGIGVQAVEKAAAGRAFVQAAVGKLAARAASAGKQAAGKAFEQVAAEKTVGPGQGG